MVTISAVHCLVASWSRNIFVKNENNICCMCLIGFLCELMERLSVIIFSVVILSLSKEETVEMEML